MLIGSVNCNILPYVNQSMLEKYLYRVERKYSMTEKRLQEQKEKEGQNKVWHY